MVLLSLELPFLRFRYPTSLDSPVSHAKKEQNETTMMKVVPWDRQALSFTMAAVF